MAETRRKFDEDFRGERSGWSGRPASRSPRWPGTRGSTKGTLGNWANADRRSPPPWRQAWAAPRFPDN
jgi:hypothetical protein